MLHIGIDLHGTLITDDEKIPAEALKPLLNVLKKIKAPGSIKIKLYLCTGNDLGFVNRKIPEQVLEYFDGYVLETGCVVSSNKKEEKILVPADSVKQIKKLEELLKKENYKEVYKFARRLATISIFTRYGEDLEAFYEKIRKKVAELEFNNLQVTHSSVAADVLPAGFDKFSGLKHFAGDDEDAVTIGIADSMNDIPLLIKADYGFLPKVSHKKVLSEIETNGKKARLLSLVSSEPAKDAVLHTEKPATFGVIEILEYVASNHNLFK